MTPIFYKNFWNIIGKDLISVVQHFFEEGRLSKAINHTFISPIPKKQAANKVEQFRPIMLCNVAYKVVTKILASRMREILAKIIHLSQVAFIPNRSITDNCIINHEIMHYLRLKKGKCGLMAIKIDMAKAYDMVEWNILMHILHLHGFNDKFCNLILECISIAFFLVLVNGSPAGFFSSSRGLKQGDPISPALFTILSDLLSRMLSNAEASGKISGIKISRTSPRISHLMYAEDLVIYCKANIEEATEVVKCLTKYCECTGQRINWDKSMVHFSSNVLAADQRDLCHSLSMKECTHSSTYLGNSFFQFGKRKEAFKGILEKLHNRLSG